MGKKKTIIIEGITEEGKVFRPADWNERLSGSLCTFRNRRMTYSPLLQPIEREGARCVLLDADLEKSNPALYQTILDFARTNHLKMRADDSGDNASQEDPIIPDEK